MAVIVHNIAEIEVAEICGQQESHFWDAKSIRIAPSKMTKTLSAFANADGGELVVGLEEQEGKFVWAGFSSIEDANGHIQAFEELFPLGEYFDYAFLCAQGRNGLILKAEIRKTSDIRRASDRIAYLRRGAQNLPQTTPEQLRRLELNKGISSYENEIVDDDLDAILTSDILRRFSEKIIPRVEPRDWLRKQKMIRGGRPTVGGELLFNDEPQSVVPKASIKIYRYKTSQGEGSRSSLAFDPLTIEGSIYDMIDTAVRETVRVTEQIPAFGRLGFEAIKYPPEAIHELVTNAVIHRDYSIHDDVHIRVFDNRVEIQSPGRLPGHVTVDNILSERFARNPSIVRILNKFPNPPNKDVGEGLNTAFEVMRNLKLKAPEIRQTEGAVIVFLWHEPLASYEEMIVRYLRDHHEINNSRAREICKGESETRMKKLFTRMMQAGTIERVPGRRRRAIAYRLATKPLET